MAILNITEAAAEKASALLEKSGNPRQALRVLVRDGGCSGMRYELCFDEEVREDDNEFRQHGLRVVVDADSAGYLAGTTVDFVEGLNESGFKIGNPNAAETCGCGESFKV